MIERITPNAENSERLRRLRLLALKNAPDAFAATLQETVARPPETWTQQLKTLHTLFAVVDGVDVGMARLAWDDHHAETAWLISMWIAPVARGKGCGDALVRALVKDACQAGARRLLLEVADENQFAIALYQRHGFEPNGFTSTLPAPRDHVTEHQRELRL